MKKNLICVVCPRGCSIEVCLNDDGGMEVSGKNATICQRGKTWAQEEFHNPVRTLTTSIAVENGEQPLLSLKSSRPVPLKLLEQIMREVRTKTASAPVQIGQVIIRNPANCGADLIATRKIPVKKSSEL